MCSASLKKKKEHAAGSGPDILEEYSVHSSVLPVMYMERALQCR